MYVELLKNKVLKDIKWANKTEMAIAFGFKWTISLSQGITRVITFRIDLLCLHLDNSELQLFLSAAREHANTNKRTPLMKIENIVLRNEWRGIGSLSLRQFVSTFTLSPLCPLWLTWAPLCTYRLQIFNFFQNWNHFNYSQCIRELKV